LVDSHLFVAGRVRVRIADFHTFLCGTEEQPGFLRSSDLPYEKKDFSEERLRQYAHFLGFAFDDTGTGAFNDAHESDENRKDRHERFFQVISISLAEASPPSRTRASSSTWTQDSKMKKATILPKREGPWLPSKTSMEMCSTLTWVATSRKAMGLCLC